MMNKNATLFLVVAILISVSLSFWFTDNGNEIEQDGRSVHSIQLQDKAANEQEAPIDLGEAATGPDLFGVFEIIDTETLEVTFNAADLKNSEHLTYVDPLTGETHQSKPVRNVISVASEALTVPAAIVAGFGSMIAGMWLLFLWDWKPVLMTNRSVRWADQ
jgi:preprotein translocase subunit SecF